MIVALVLDRHGHVAERVRLTQLPAMLGRAYDCAVVLDDAHVEAHHAEVRLDEQGGIVVRDLGTVNGTWAAARREPGTGSGEIALGAAGEVRLGHTRVRLVRPDVPVPPARPVVIRRGWAAALEQPRTALAAGAAALAVVFGGLWLGDTSANGLAAITSTGLGLVFVVAAWAGVWAFAGRLNVQRPAFLAHAALTLVAIVALGLLSALGAYVEILLGVPRVAGAAVLGVGTAVIVALVYTQLGFATLQPARTRLIRAMLVVAIVWGLGEALDRADQDSPAYVEVEVPLRPVPAWALVGRSADGVLERTAPLRRELDALVAKDADR